MTSKRGVVGYSIYLGNLVLFIRWLTKTYNALVPCSHAPS